MGNKEGWIIIIIFAGAFLCLFTYYGKPDKPYSQIISEQANKAIVEADGAKMCASYKGSFNITQEEGIFYTGGIKIPAKDVGFVKCPDEVLNQLK